MKNFISFVFITFAISATDAHTRWSLTGLPSPRSTSAGLKNGPCGGIPRGIARQFQAGATINVEWEETIDHPGRFEIYFSQANETNFQLLKTITDTQNDNNIPHQYSTSITLPNVNCTTCVLRIIQVMTENPASPSLYYSCSDIQLVGSTMVGPLNPGVPPVPGGPEEKCH